MKRRVAAAVVLAGLVVGAGPLWRHLRAASLLIAFSEPLRTGIAVALSDRKVTTGPLQIPSPRGPVEARLYLPDGEARGPGIVIIHGVHRLGIEEPRLVRFSNAFARSGYVVLTPLVKELAAFEVAPASVEEIGVSIHALRERLGKKVAVLGLSFAGGLGLVAAADPRWSGDVSCAIAVGAHHDLTRVMRFFATGEEPRPDGGIDRLAPHEYGPLVLAHAHAEAFFPAEDAAAAKHAIELWLAERQAEARTAAQALSAPAKAKVEALFAGKIAPVAQELVALADGARDESAKVSPAGHLSGMAAPVFLLHGAGDNVIPPAESLWLARETPKALLRSALISPAVVHVELGEVTWRDHLALVHWLAGVLSET